MFTYRKPRRQIIMRRWSPCVSLAISFKYNLGKKSPLSCTCAIVAAAEPTQHNIAYWANRPKIEPLCEGTSHFNARQSRGVALWMRWKALQTFKGQQRFFTGKKREWLHIKNTPRAYFSHSKILVCLIQPLTQSKELYFSAKDNHKLIHRHLWWVRT